MSEQPASHMPWLFDEGKPVTYREDHPLQDLIAEAIDELDNEEDIWLINMIAWEGLTFGEAAARLGLKTKQAAHWRFSRALESLAAILKRKGVDYVDD